MEKMMYDFTKSDITKVYDEVDRRINIAINDGDFTGCVGSPEWQDEIDDHRAVMMQGVYSTLMVLAKDWSAVVQMIRVEEEERA